MILEFNEILKYICSLLKSKPSVNLPYNKKLTKLARELRNNSTKGEITLWNYLKHHSLGYDFHRQKPILEYIVDFYSPDLSLAIEVDGETHDDEKKPYDEIRQKEIEALGIRFLRFDNNTCALSPEIAVRKIKRWIESNKPEDS